ncbi:MULTISPECIES: restriction endonuclease subunit S [unclassified Mesorhizobium]|uniref:restriction endonuclease subunit S n=1 Tax=unclassified Mesorhizobium TaxID=325217 RepID=UPI00167B4BE3|nr:MULTISPECIES: restriction endonuclease subunit S [unclassified Mesorhizobium]
MSYSQKLIGDFCREGIVELQTGPFGSQLHSYDYVEDGVPVIPTEAIKERRIVLDGLPRVARETADRLSKHQLLLDDILFARRGAQATGQTAIVRDQDVGAICGTGAIRLRVRRKQSSLLPAFLSHFLSSPEAVAWIRAQAIGATMPNLNEGIIKRIAVPVPPFDLQTRMATTLNDLDDKIELNRRTNETLEAVAQAIFRDWFIDFGPTRRKIEGATNPLEIMGGLVIDPERVRQLADLFPATLGDDGLPDGFDEFQLEDIASQHTSTLTPLAFSHETFAHHSLPAFDKDRNPIIETGAAILSNKTIVPPSSVLLSKLNPEISRVWLPADHADHRAVCSTEFLAFTAKKGFGRALVYSLFSSTPFRSLLTGMVTGTSKSHQRISPKALVSQVVLATSMGVGDAFEALVAPFLQRIQHNRAENRTLAGTRDLLLPKLMSGEIRLSEAEQLAGAAA